MSIAPCRGASVCRAAEQRTELHASEPRWLLGCRRDGSTAKHETGATLGKGQ